ncbi:ATP-binding protein [Actinomadura sp. SCN-SB]|uniref:ATP-binding protein n=1 Tax=Actinomadura sp. SCN-SB TaxID=3373092 RepID=UPI0037520548
MSPETVTSRELDLTCLAAETAAGQVRLHIEIRLGEWGLLGIAQDVYLIAGELVANAVQVTPDGHIRVRFTREPGAVLLGVWDASDAMPKPKPVVELSPLDIEPDPRALDPGHDDGTGGWGLPIVQALSSECGVTPTVPHGKWVWARVQAHSRRRVQ